MRNIVLLLLLLVSSSVVHGFWVLNQREEKEGEGGDLKGELAAESEDEGHSCFPKIFNPGCFLNQFVPWGAVCKTNTLRWRQCEVLKQQEEQVGREEAATEEEEEEVEEANEDREGKVAGLLPASGSSGVKPVHGKPGMKVFSAVPEGGLEVREATKEEEEEEEEAEVAVEAVEMAIEEVFEDVIKTLKEIEDPIEDWDH